MDKNKILIAGATGYLGKFITKELVENNFDNFWYQPGAESEEISNFLNENKKNFIDDKCIMVVTKLN